ncbi:hypothetical protein [Gaetbulibacter aestuarii]|uniref:Uncharacterized protein n=1 Tax=Gaetbulibacter aestuarii TaxID=1502358 RepID=A0ABW7N0Q5_9FLAO
MDDFYLKQYLYIDLFLREGLLADASKEEVSSVLTAIKKYVSPETPLSVEIEKPGKQNYLIRIVDFQKDGDELLVAFTNWSVKKQAFEKDIKMENDCYTRWYFLNGDKMTYRKDMSTENDYAGMSQIDLANAYLYDELTENDDQIKPTIEAALNDENVTLPDMAMGHILMLMYHMFQKDQESVNKDVATLNDLFDTHSSESSLRGLKGAFEVTKFQMDLMK